MKILAVDTASKSCSVAVVNEHVLTADITFATGETHSKTLMRSIEEALKGAHLAISDIDAFAVTRGPGSFTGLRIGISTIKGLAFAQNKPVAGVSTLDVLAFPFSFSRYLVCPMVDARRKEVYFSKIRFDENGTMKKEAEEKAMPPDAAIKGIDEPCIFVGDGSVIYRDLISDCMSGKAFFAPAFMNVIRASVTGYLGLEKIKNNEAVSAKELEPLYLRKSDAEIKKPGPSF